MSKAELRPKIGIVGGVGPLAGANVLLHVMRIAAQEYGAVEDHEYPDVILTSQGIADVGETAGLTDDFRRVMVQGVRSVKRSGATVVGIACNTAHLYYPDLKKACPELLHLPSEVAKIAARYSKRTLLLTSRTSLEHDLYGEPLRRSGVDFSTVDERTQSILDKVVGLVMAYRLSEAGNTIQTVLEQANEAGFGMVVAGCTELPIAIENCAGVQGVQVVSSNEVLARALVGAYYAQCNLQNKGGH